MSSTAFFASCAGGDVRLRAGGPSDAVAAANVWLRSRRRAIPAIPAPIHTDDEVRTFFTETVVPNWELYVAEPAPGGVVGLMVLNGHWLQQFYLDPDWTGRGIGTCFIDLAKRLRPNGLELWSFVSNVDARRLYERLGFVAVETSDDNEEHALAVHYRWSGGK
jgi:GNAT superfamily N-acetyltransferase